ncbi:MAG TPA: hypothetical protein VJ889_26225, partial [Pseudomonas sp.]|nr:hypothetical protein [Pseudomonas sp.]
GNGFVVHEVEQDFGDLQATDLNVFSHCLPHSAQLFRFSALQFNNEASGHLNHKPFYQYMPLLAAGFGPINGVAAFADRALRVATAPVADIDPTLCSARCGILHDELRL